MACVWLPLVGPKLEMETKIRDTVGLQASPGRLGPVNTEIIVLFHVLPSDSFQVWIIPAALQGRLT